VRATQQRDWLSSPVGLTWEAFTKTNPATLPVRLIHQLFEPGHESERLVGQRSLLQDASHCLHCISLVVTLKCRFDIKAASSLISRSTKMTAPKSTEASNSNGRELINSLPTSHLHKPVDDYAL
jgi:hypothetical protein